MRLLKFGLGLLFLRWLPFGFLTRWLLRVAVWGGLIYAAIRKFKPELLAPPAQAPFEPSAWTAPAPRQFEPEPTSSAGVTSTDTVTIDIEETIVVESAEQRIDRSEPAPIPDIAGDEMVDVIVSASMALDDMTETEPEPYEPKWIRGDGSLDCPDDFPVKAKAQSLIFHTIGTRNYDHTVPDVCFASAEDAQIAGYRAPLR